MDCIWSETAIALMVFNALVNVNPKETPYQATHAGPGDSGIME